MRKVYFFAIIALAFTSGQDQFQLTFDFFDGNHDGSLVVEEVKEYCGKMDSNGDGNVVFEEFEIMAEATPGPNPALQAQFDIYDKFGGKLNGLIRCSEDSVTFFTSLDADGSGIVTVPEFEAGFAKMSATTAV